MENLVYLTSHELKSPLRAFRFLAESVREELGDKLEADARSDFDELMMRADRMNAIVDGLLSYSRVGRFEEKRSKVNLSELLAQIKKNVDLPTTFQLVAPRNLPTIETAKEALLQVLRVIIQNAYVHHDKDTGTIQVDVMQANQKTEIIISDDGPGINEGEIDKLFEFFHPDRPKAEQGGVGLGLALAKKLVETQGGKIEVSPAKGRGTTFKVTWPDASTGNARPDQLEVEIPQKS
jgi:signal transduction histidine kinase